MQSSHRMEISDNIVELFHNKRYEKYVLEIMNISTTIFPEKYEYVTNQSNGECDFIEVNTGIKYDAKIPFYPNQIEMLTSGKKHQPQIIEWIQMMHDEAAEFDEVIKSSPRTLDVAGLKLYELMKEQIVKEKLDENIVFFLPYPIILSVNGSIFMQFAANYLNSIYTQLEKGIDLTGRSIFVIFPSSRKNEFAIKNMKSYYTEYIQYDKMNDYFSYEMYI